MASNKVALVTGAGTGVGKGVTLGLLGAGYAVVLAGRRREPLEATAKEGGGTTLVVETNVGDPASVDALFAKIKETFGRLDLLFINAGSISAHAPRPNSAPYTATKHAITGLTKSIALDGRKFDIACGQIDIGNAETDMARRMKDGVPQADGSVRPEPLMDPVHVANAVVHMASLPKEANVLFMTVMAAKMPFVGRG